MVGDDNSFFFVLKKKALAFIFHAAVRVLGRMNRRIFKREKKKEGGSITLTGSSKAETAHLAPPNPPYIYLP